MTEVTLTETQMPPVISRRPLWQRAAAMGSGLGIDASGPDLHAAIIHSRANGPRLIAETTIRSYRSRPAAEWGAELSAFLTAAGESQLAATVVLPRNEVIVRSLSLPGVADKDVQNAIELQIETLHPYGEDEAAWSWSRTNPSHVMIGIARKTIIEEYETLFGEAGIPLAGISFAPALIHAATRVWSLPPKGAVCIVSVTGTRTEVYGESDARPVYSAELAVPGSRAMATAKAELRLPADAPELTLAELLPRMEGQAPESELACAAAMSGAAARIARYVNLLPEAHRASHDRMSYLMPTVLGGIAVVVVLISLLVLPAMEDRRYRAGLAEAEKAAEPAANRARNLERGTAAARARIGSLDEFRARPQLDLDTLSELTRLLAPPTWTNSIELYPDSVTITGETDDAAPLLKQLDSSPLFQNSEFLSSVVRTQGGEQFRIRTMRRGRTGRTTP